MFAIFFKMDPIGNTDGRIMNQEVGELQRYFETKPNYAVFVSVQNVVKITPANLLSTLTDAIQKLNKNIVSLSKTNYEYLQQMDKQQHHINHLTEKNKQLTKLAAQKLEKINDQKAVTFSHKNVHKHNNILLQTK